VRNRIFCHPGERLCLATRHTEGDAVCTCTKPYCHIGNHVCSVCGENWPSGFKLPPRDKYKSSPAYLARAAKKIEHERRMRTGLKAWAKRKTPIAQEAARGSQKR
jgi:hypothetical protein